MKTLKDAYKNYFKVGAAVSKYSLDSCKEIVLQHFDSITCENEMKYSGVCNEKEEYDFTDADMLYNFAKENGIEVRGHNFVWHQSVPTERLEEFSPEELWERIKEHIKLVSRRYPDVSCWDVINEAIDDKHGLYLRDTVWLRKFGEDYCRKVYALARELVPNVPLVYNDYNEFMPDKREKMIRLVKELKSEGLVDIIGLQGHITVPEFFSLDELKRTLEEFGALGLKLQITELDISLPGINTEKSIDDVSEEEIDAHAKLYGDVFKVYREYSELIDSVTLWGVTDDMGWLNFCFGNRKRNALLFGRDHKPNKAFIQVTEF